MGAVEAYFAPAENLVLKRILRTSAALIIVALVAGMPGPLRARGAIIESCRSFVEQFYNYYEPLEPGHSLEHTSLGDAVEKKQFDPDLAEQLRVVLDSQAKSGQIVLDFDPIINGREPADKYVTGSVTRKGEHYLVEVYGVSDDGKKHDKPAVIAEVESESGEWMFANFYYPNRTDSTEGDNLRSMLTRILRLQREENRAQPAGGAEGAPR